MIYNKYRKRQIHKSGFAERKVNKPFPGQSRMVYFLLCICLSIHFLYKTVNKVIFNAKEHVNITKNISINSSILPPHFLTEKSV